MAGPTTVWQLALLLFEMLAGCKWFHSKEFIRNEIQTWFGSKGETMLVSMCSYYVPSMLQLITVDSSLIISLSSVLSPHRLPRRLGKVFGFRA